MVKLQPSEELHNIVLLSLILLFLLSPDLSQFSNLLLLLNQIGGVVLIMIVLLKEMIHYVYIITFAIITIVYRFGFMSHDLYNEGYNFI
jgi:hypothetical protein